MKYQICQIQVSLLEVKFPYDPMWISWLGQLNGRSVGLSEFSNMMKNYTSMLLSDNLFLPFMVIEPL